MKKLLFLLVLFCATNMILAQSKPTRTILHPTTNGNTNQGGHGRAPLAPMYVYQDGNQLTFESCCIGCPITLIDADETTVFTTFIDETGVVELPNDLVGIFELELVRDSITFVGEIEL